MTLIGSTNREAYPLQWPDGWIRTRSDHRRPNGNWKKTFGAYRDHLVDELERLGAVTAVISTNVPINLRGLPHEGFSPVDPGVAVYFTRRRRQDLSWQEVLDLGTAPTPDQVEHRVRELVKKYSPDVAGGGDVEIFRAVIMARDRARDYFAGRGSTEHEYSIACDLFREVRLNMHSIGLTIEAMRQIDRCGASSILERAFRGFQAALPAKGQTA